jgi:hypothetical protein
MPILSMASIADSSEVADAGGARGQEATAGDITVEEQLLEFRR